MNETQSFIETYKEEADELLIKVEETLLEIEENPNDKEASSLRVASDKLYTLVDLVGELVTVQARLSQLSEKGTIRLSAVHKGAYVVITIEDDGAGLDPEIIRKKAIEKGLISKEVNLTNKEIFELIFMPGFSTAGNITNVSGRGVGMDVVKKTIESLRGAIDVDSTQGKGSTIKLKLPLTLAIINGLLVTIGDVYYVLPLTSVEECVELSQNDIDKMHGSNILNVRGEIIPYVRLRDHFNIEIDKPPFEHIVVTDVHEKRVGFVVDNVIGGHQTVIKSLSPSFKHLKDISGATILGDGTVALILDVNGLI